ncbi:hypothetical protein HLB25_21385 [Dickeya dadantii]|uniref:hypothetical protein n=1 Tax=Dickeya dadantii TaxID=204038 RepID=UPI0014960B83|nr:hypothetical protein [Dickeya dadantii]NPE57108.1 hypothetical protein [Dickeya dadantii]NPE69062.1 hypothetical protein [Dickeya dadantii]
MRQITASEVKKLVENHCGKLDKTDPYWRQARIAKDQAETAIAYTTDKDFTMTPRARNAVINWANDLKSAF